MTIVPTHADLEYKMQSFKGGVPRHLDPPPDGRFCTLQSDFQLVYRCICRSLFAMLGEIHFDDIRFFGRCIAERGDLITTIATATFLKLFSTITGAGFVASDLG